MTRLQVAGDARQSPREKTPKNNTSETAFIPRKIAGFEGRLERASRRARRPFPTGFFVRTTLRANSSRASRLDAHPLGYSSQSADLRAFVACVTLSVIPEFHPARGRRSVLGGPDETPRFDLVGVRRHCGSRASGSLRPGRLPKRVRKAAWRGCAASASAVGWGRSSSLFSSGLRGSQCGSGLLLPRDGRARLPIGKYGHQLSRHCGAFRSNQENGSRICSCPQGRPTASNLTPPSP
jgi:hypothetical protein